MITVDGEQVYTAAVGGPDDHKESAADILASRVVDRRADDVAAHPDYAGPHEVGFTWVERPALEQNAWQPSLRDSQEAHNPAGIPRLETANIAGPFDVSGVSDTAIRERRARLQARDGRRGARVREGDLRDAREARIPAARGRRRHRGAALLL